MSLDSLRAELATADLIGAGLIPGDELTGDTITAAQARRLACTAKLIPAVLGGDSIPLDLGRAQRFFSPGQRKALLLRDQTCRAEGVRRPRHLGRGPPPRNPWSHGGRPISPTALLLCSHHHHRAHDTGYRTDRLPNGDLRFHRRKSADLLRPARACLEGAAHHPERAAPSSLPEDRVPVTSGTYLAHPVAPATDDLVIGSDFRGCPRDGGPPAGCLRRWRGAGRRCRR